MPGTEWIEFRENPLWIFLYYLQMLNIPYMKCLACWSKKGFFVDTTATNVLYNAEKMSTLL